VEVFRALGVIAEPPVPETERLLRVLEIEGQASAPAYAELFAFQLYPYASVYLGPEGMMRGEARDRIAGFWRAIGETPPAEPDHLAVLLGLYARLAELTHEAEDAKARAAWEQAQRALLWEHLTSWLPVYLLKVDELASEPYRSWGRALHDCLRAEWDRFPAPAALSLHLRDAPGLAPAAGMEALIAALLAPVRSGLIITRTDLARAARDVGLGLRAGERRYVLASFLEQDPHGTVMWLADEAERVGAAYGDRIDLAEVAGFWVSRVEGTASFLRALTLEGAPHA
jgi:TorA maturation chaperone TorD